MTVTNAWARATLPHQDTSAIYLTLQSAKGDMLAGVSTPAAGMAMLHKDTVSGGMAGMADMDSVMLPPGRKVIFAPNGMHIMLMDLKHPLRAGDVLHLQLQLEHGAQDVAVTVRPFTATGP